MVDNGRGYCNWEYTGEYDTDKNGRAKSAELTTDCGRTVIWTRHNKIGELFKYYNRQSVPMGERFPVDCPFCRNELNIVNPFDDGETWRK